MTGSIPPTPPTPDYHDEWTVLAVDPPDGSRPTIRLRAAGTGVGCVVDLTATGAHWLAGMLDGAVRAAVAGGLPGGLPTEEDEQ